jgi:outer membrane receptor protein involved in Fe transport
VGNKSLQPEQIVAFELGYRGESASLGLDWDIALYQNQVSNLITLSAIHPFGPGQPLDPPTQSYLVGFSQFINDPTSYTARGVELGTHWSPIDGLDLRASAAFQTVSADNLPAGVSCIPCQEAAAVKVYGGIAYRSKLDIDAAVDGSFTSSTTWIERQPSTVDPTQIAEAQYPLAAYAVINARLAYNIIHDKLTLALVGSQLGPDHQEHPFGNLVTRRFFATLTVRP